MSTYNRCIVPSCLVTSINSPGKVFINVPRGERRHAWFRTLGMTDSGLSIDSHLTCCQDHFNLPEDIANYEWYQYAKGLGMKSRMQLKPDALPRFLLCPPLPEVRKRKKKKKIDIPNNDLTSQVKPLLLHEDEELGVRFIVGNDEFSYRPETAVRIEEANNDIMSLVKNCSPVLTLSKVRTVECIPDPPPEGNKKKRRLCENDNANSDEIRSTDQAFQVTHKPEQLAKMSMWLMEENVRCYLGLPQERKGIIEILANSTIVSREEIFLALRKINLGESNERLGHCFNMTQNGVSRSLNRSIPLLAAFLQKYVFWPPSDVIQGNLPNAFKEQYSKVQAIIDCFEIEIEKPTDVNIQAQNLSDHKKCSTMKYLISSTPDGFINFISKGYGGCSTNNSVVEKSGFLNRLRPDTLVMADRRFKQIDSLLQERDCQLVRPPSISADSAMTNEEVRETKTFESLRVQVERVIQRVREFSFLAPHAVFHHDLLAVIDSVVLVACALINMQHPVLG